MRENDGIRVEVQHLFGFNSTESFSVEFESGPTCGETGHEDVDVDLNGICLLHVFVDHFDHLVVHDAGLKFLTVILEELVQLGWGRKGFHFPLVTLLTVLAPETVQHHFGQGTPTWVLLDLVGLEGDTFLGSRRDNVAMACEDNSNFVPSAVWVVLVPRKFCRAGR